MHTKALLFALFLLSGIAVAADEAGTRDGQLREHAGSWQAWDLQQGQWLGVVDFWRAYADRRGGITWGENTNYPPYEQVNELDTFLVQLPAGPCLMEFWHARWRIANDVRRWDTRFNDLLGCPQVFD